MAKSKKKSTPNDANIYGSGSKPLSDAEFDALPDSGGVKPLSDAEFDALPSTPKPSSPGKPMEAFLQGAGDAASMGYSPQLAALVSKLVPNPDAAVDTDLKSKGFNVSQPSDDYVDVRDTFAKRQEALKASNPGLFGAGTVAGIVGGGAPISKGFGLLGQAAAEAAPAIKNVPGLLKTIGGGAIQGAATAAAYNPGDVEGEINPVQLADRKQAAKLGGLIGGAIPAITAIPKAVGSTVKHLAAHTSGLPEHDIATYAAKTKEVNDLIKATGGDMSEIADTTRAKLSKGIQEYRRGINEAIGKELQSVAPDAKVDASKIMDSLKKSLSEVDPDLNPDQYKYISELGEKVAKKIKPDGGISLQDAHKLTEFFQKEAKGTYMGGGQVFPKGDDYARAAKAAGAAGREIRNQASEQLGNSSIKEGYKSLSELHDLEKTLNKNLITPGKTDSAFFAAANESNPRNARMLEKLSDMTGVNAMEQAKLASAARTFGNTGIFPGPLNGAMAGKLGAGLLVGGAAGESVGGHGKEGGLIGAAATSPLAVKGAINAGNMVSGLVPNVVKSGVSNLGKSINPAMAGMAAGAASSKGFQADPFVTLSQSPDNIKRAVEQGIIPMEAVKSIVNKSGALTREDYIKATRVLGSAQGRQAMRAAMFHVSTVDNPDLALGPAAPVVAQDAIQRGNIHGRR